jgi:hypothetical protein
MAVVIVEVITIQEATTFVIPGLRVSEEPGTHDEMSALQRGMSCLTPSWIPGSRLRHAPE